MIIFKKSGLLIDNPKMVKSHSDEVLLEIKKMEQINDFEFVVPQKFKSNSERNTYKTGFISSFLRNLYPLKKSSEICEIMNRRYQIFLSRRQIERIYSKYNSDEKFTN